MTNLVIDPDDVKIVAIWNEIALAGNESVTDRRGKYMRVDVTDGGAVLGNATTAAEIGNLKGIALSNQNVPSASVSLLRHGLLDLGAALDALAYDDAVFLSDTDGVLADVQGTVAEIVGYVWPGPMGDGFGSGATTRKLLYINTLE